MSQQSWQETLITSPGDGTALNTSTTATSILPVTAKYSLYPNFFDRIGKQILVQATGRMSNIVTTPGTLTLEVRFGATTVVASGGAIALNTTAKTNVTWMIFWLLTCRAIGASANLIHSGEFVSESVVGSAAGVANTAMLPASAPAVGSNFDSMASQTVDLYATFSISNASNSIQVHQFALTAMN